MNSKSKANRPSACAWEQRRCSGAAVRIYIGAFCWCNMHRDLMDQHKNARNILAYAVAQDSLFARKDIQHLCVLCRRNPRGGSAPEPVQGGRKIALEIVE